MKPHTTIYLSGPMSRVPQFNIPLFDEEAERLRRMGFEVVSPAELDKPEFRDLCLLCHTGEMDDLHRLCEAKGLRQDTWGELLARDVKLLSDDGIEAVFLLPGWEQSRGARLESFVAILNDIPLYKEGVGYEFERVTPTDWYVSTAPPLEGVEYITAQDAAAGALPPGFTAQRGAEICGPGATSFAVEGGEVRVTDPSTGGQKGEKPQAFNLLPWKELGEVAKLYRAGLVKYNAHNWRKGYAWHLSFDSLIRHATQWWEGESLDSETGCSHLASVVFHALALMHFEAEHPEKDDRPNVR